MILPGVYGRASELVGCDPAYRKAVDFLLNNVLLCDTMDTALEAAKALRYRSHVVTLDGDMVSPGATVSGGSRQAKAGELLSKKSRLREAREELVQSQQVLAQYVAKLEESREQLRQVTAENEAAREQLHTLAAAGLAQKNAADQQRLHIQTITQREKGIQDQLEELTDELTGLDSGLAEDLSDQEQLRQELRRLNEEMEAAQEGLTAVQEQLERYRNQVTEQKMTLAASQQKLR